MGFLNSLAIRDSGVIEQRSEPGHPREVATAALFSDPSQVNITTNSAMRNTAVFACVSLIAETPAAVPLHVMQKTKALSGFKSQKAKWHPLYNLLHDMPTPGITSFEWRELMLSHTALGGDSYARIITNGGGDIVALPPLLPSRTFPELRNGRIQYRHYPENGPVEILFDDEVLRLPYKMLDGVHSLSPIATHRMTIGNAMKSSRFLSSFFDNQAQPKGALMTPETLGPEAAKELRKSWEERHQGWHNVGRMAILDGGMKWEQIGMSMIDAQYIEMQNFSVRDIARIFLVPPHKIADLANATFSNIEHQAIEFVVDTLMRWIRRFEMRMNSYLLSARDRAAGYYIAFDLKGLLRGDAQARSNFYKALFYIGAMTPNEIRAAEDQAPYEGGDRFYMQGANIPVDKIDETIVRALQDSIERRTKETGNDENADTTE